MKNSDQPRDLAPLLNAVEEELAAYYNFSPQAAVNDHLVSKQEIRAALGDVAEAQPEWQARGGVWLAATPSVADSDVFIGVNLSEEVRGVAATDPLAQLGSHNLDAFCILIEEVSHFHFLLNRMSDGRPVARAELELQGELDKLLICSRVLHLQCGDDHVLPLARTLYDTAKIVALAPDYEAYWLATKYAARFWFAPENSGGPGDTEVRARLKALYLCDWEKKRAAFEAADVGSLAA